MLMVFLLVIISLYLSVLLRKVCLGVMMKLCIMMFGLLMSWFVIRIGVGDVVMLFVLLFLVMLLCEYVLMMM